MIIGLWDTEAALQASQAMHGAAHQEHTALGLWVTPPTIEVFAVTRKIDPPQ